MFSFGYSFVIDWAVMEGSKQILTATKVLFCLLSTLVWLQKWKLQIKYAGGNVSRKSN